MVINTPYCTSSYGNFFSKRGEFLKRNFVCDRTQIKNERTQKFWKRIESKVSDPKVA
jgi:hypothetical protein